MRYFVGHFIRGKVADYYEKITSELSEKFAIKNLSLTKPPHLTLKAPFETSEIEPFKEKLLSISKKINSTPFSIKGFGRFDRGTIYLEPVQNDEVYSIADTISKEIDYFGENRLQIPRPLKLHASIARNLNPKLSNKIWQYLSTISKPHFDLIFDNVTLFKHTNHGWDNESIYEFKGDKTPTVIK